MEDPARSNRETSRRNFLKSVSAASAAALAGGSAFAGEPSGALFLKSAGQSAPAASSPASQGTEKFIAMQISAQSFVDEGVERCLDTLKEKGDVNVVMPVAFSYGWELDGRQVHGRPLPDHGVQAYDEIHGGSYTKVNPQYYAGSVIKDIRAPELGNFDILADVIPKAKARGMKTYALFAEDYNPAFIPDFEKIAEVDVYGRIGRNTCHNNPGTRDFLVSLVQDWFLSNDLDGMMWESERQGPLNTALKANFGNTARTSICCFCTHCMRKGHEQGINVQRARQGYVALDRWVNQPSSRSRQSDGSFVTLWRLLLEYPEILAWESFWFHSQEEIYGLLYGTVKEANPQARVGWHIMHLVTLSPFYRADQNYARIARTADFLKPSPYNNCGGPRLAQYIRNVQSTIFRDFTPEEVLAMHYKILGYEGQPGWDKLSSTGLSASYVARETRRAIEDVQGAVPIYPGIDIDLPTAAGDKQTEPGDVKAAVLAAFKAGAPGVVLSRKYSEMKLANLAAVGDALRELGTSGANASG
ncbi:MAG TPA: twin-arginine translocation signal domain-containing protein [Acidobacteriaceae bacterium]|nr:twin-arginine translocation signal domain-containing protein [Acidobacteriaceae bacterium]